MVEFPFWILSCKVCSDLLSSLPKQQMETCGVAYLKNWQIYLHVAQIGEEEVFFGVIAPELLSCVGRRRLLKVTCGGSMGCRVTVFHYVYILGGVPRTARSGRAGHCCQTSASAIRKSTGTGAFHVFDAATCHLHGLCQDREFESIKTLLWAKNNGLVLSSKLILEVCCH